VSFAVKGLLGMQILKLMSHHFIKKSNQVNAKSASKAFATTLLLTYTSKWFTKVKRLSNAACAKRHINQSGV
jgi:hypothetical protein